MAYFIETLNFDVPILLNADLIECIKACKDGGCYIYTTQRTFYSPKSYGELKKDLMPPYRYEG